MKQKISLNESKKIMLNILLSVDKCCRENGLYYSLDWGTLLGAVRHHAFIPWDDDIDLLMTRKEFSKFLLVYNDKNYDLITNKDSNWGWHYIRICDKTTIVEFSKDSENIRKHGLWISIFPIDHVPNDSRLWAKQKKVIMLWYSFCRIKRSKWTSNGFGKNIIKAIARVILKLVPIQYFAKKEENCMCRYDDEKSLKSFVKVTDIFEYPSQIFDSYTQLSFEGHKFMVVTKYDEYLRMKYGDYMQLPPEAERVPKHKYIAYLNK